ncbi:MAG: S8 family serine peptidase [Spirosoma sp.]|nr:S8 family serine peptidase [Spirosoma sp.]
MLNGPVVHAQVTNPRARNIIGYDFTLHGLQATRLKYPDLTGTGLTISIKEDPFDTTDIDFRGRITPTPAGSGPYTDHATTMTSLLGGAGNLVSTSRGVAPGVRLASSSFARLLPDSLADLRQLGISIQNHSYGVDIERFYGPEALAYDRQVAQEPTLLHVFSSGNSGAETTASAPLPAPYLTLTGEFKQAKNVLVVGGINGSDVLEPRSSAGPTADGRIRPELVAYGNNGTSESAALVSGVGALLQQTYRNQTGRLPSVAWVRACLLASCGDIGLPGPDHRAGFGSLNALGAVTLAQHKQYWTDTVSQRTARSFTLTVPTGTARLAVSLVWSDTPTATGTLRQDLDLWLEPLDKPDELIQPWTLSTGIHPDSIRLPARRGIDRTNNVEQVSVLQPAPGRYRVWVRGTNLPDGPQPFAVAYALDSTLTWVAPTTGATLMTGQAQPLRWKWLGNADERGTVSVRLTGDTDWQPIAETIRLAGQLTQWIPPSRNSLAQLRIVTASRTYLSDTFALVRPLPVRVLLNCPNQVAVSWARQPGVSAYQVYKLGRQYLEPIRQISDTVAFLNPADGPFVAVWPVLAGQPRQAEYTINYTRQGVGCYTVNWLARQVVADTAQLDLTLSTTYNLERLTLERATASGIYTTLQTLTPTPGQTRYTFTDRPPAVGATRYRIRLTTQTGQNVFTDNELVYGVQPPAPFVFPNPVSAGEPLTVVVPDDETAATWFTIDGRAGVTMPLTGVLKQMPTAGLPPGLHLLRLDGPRSGRQVVPVIVQ